MSHEPGYFSIACHLLLPLPFHCSRLQFNNIILYLKMISKWNRYENLKVYVLFIYTVRS